MPEEKRQNELETDTEQDIEQMMNDIPEDVKSEIMDSIMSVHKTQSMAFPAEALIMSKINEEHISEYLAASRENMQNSYAEKKQNKIFRGFMILVAMLFVVLVILLLRTQPVIMEKIIYIILGFLGGAAGGYGVGRNKERD